ncbi:MAG: glycosyltransferase family 2 protein, partial [Actinobacteria bacterium]|nr:glycosyltransferase family 2 protein [Actinomycetota bacterium]
MNNFLLQRLTLPRAETTEPLLYVRAAGDAQVADGRVLLRAGAELSFDTSFGVFAAGRWRRLSTIENLSVNIFATGSGRIE